MMSSPDSCRLLFTSVCRGQTLLAKHAECVGNFTDINQKLLQRIWTGTDEGTEGTKGTFNRASLSSGGYVFHFLKEDQAENGLVFIAITDEGFPPKAAFECLDRVKMHFQRQFPLSAESTSLSVPLSLNSELAPMLANEMNRASRVGQEDKIQRIQGEVDSVRDLMVQNIESIVERGERLDLLIDKTENLSSESSSFRQSGRRLERKMWWQNTKMKVCMGVGVGVIIYAIVSFSCGGPLWPKCV